MKVSKNWKHVTTNPEYLINLCESRIEKYGGLGKSKSCRGCKYKYVGNEKQYCCIFGTAPRDWREQ